MYYAMPVLAVFNVFSTLLLYLIFSYDNFPYDGCRRYLDDETDRSAHPGSAEVVIKPITSSNDSPRWAQWPRVAGRGGLRRVAMFKNVEAVFVFCNK